MTRDDVMTLIQEARAAGKNPDLTGADLTGADLREADLTDANLTWADLRGADLRGAKVNNVTWPFFISGDADLTGAK